MKPVSRHDPYVASHASVTIYFACARETQGEAIKANNSTGQQAIGVGDVLCADIDGQLRFTAIFIIAGA